MIQVPDDYRNEVIDFANLPSSDGIELTPLDPRFYKQMVLETSIWSIILLIVAVVGYFFLREYIPPYLYWLSVGVLVLLAVMHILWMKKAFKARGYAVRERDVSVRRGLFFRRIRTVPICKIQQVTVRQSIIERSLGLYKLDISDGSQGATAVVIPGLTQERAYELREHLLKQIS